MENLEIRTVSLIEPTYIWVANPNDVNPNAYVSGLNRREVAISTNASDEASSEATSEETSTEKVALSEKMEIAAEEEFDTGDYDIIRTTEGIN